MYRVTTHSFAAFTAIALALASFLGGPLSAIAQDDADSPRPFIYSTYFECASTEEWLVDMIVETVYKPVYDAAVEDGTLSRWGWLSHHTGGKWRRAIFRIGTFDAVYGNAIAEEIREANSDAARKFGEICSSHEDYIWQPVNSSGGAGNVADTAIRPKAGVSMYMVCEMAKQERADELIAAFAPIYNRHVADGELSSWVWAEHVVGGEYRRLLTMRGADHMSVMAGWAAIAGEIDEEQEAASTEFDEICHTHQDYAWNIVH